MAIPESIRKFVETHGIGFTSIHHRLAYTAQEEAAATHVPGREWAKTVVCIADGRPVLALLPAKRPGRPRCAALGDGRTGGAARRREGVLRALSRVRDRRHGAVRAALRADGVRGRSAGEGPRDHVPRGHPRGRDAHDVCGFRDTGAPDSRRESAGAASCTDAPADGSDAISVGR